MADQNALMMINPFEALETGRKRAYAGYEAGQAAAQREALNELYAQSVDPRTGTVDRNKLYFGLASRRMGEMIPGLQLEEAKLGEQRGKALQEQTKGLESRMQYWKRLLPSDPRLAPAWVSAMYADPVVGPELSKFGSAEETIAAIPQNPVQYGQWAEGASMFADEYAKRRTLTEQQSRDLEMRGRTATIQERQARTAAARERRLSEPAATAPTVQPPKLKQGERWNAELQRVEAVPGSDLYVKQKKEHTKDFDTVKSTSTEMTLGRDKIDALLDPKNEREFNNLFGGYAAYATGRLSGKTATLRTELNSLKSNLKTAGKRIISSAGSGAIGQITEREWPILESMLGELVPEMDVPGARAKLAEIRAQLDKMERLAKESYETTWADSQYFKDIPIGSRPAAAPQPAAPDAPVGAGKSYPTEAAAEAAFKAGKLKAGERVTIGGVSGTWK